MSFSVQLLGQGEYTRDKAFLIGFDNNNKSKMQAKMPREH